MVILIKIDGYLNGLKVNFVDLFDRFKLRKCEFFGGRKINRDVIGGFQIMCNPFFCCSRNVI